MNLQTMLIVGVILTAIIGGGWTYITWHTQKLEETITKQQEQIAELTIEKTALQSSVSVLQTQLNQQRLEASKSIEETIRLRQSDVESKARLASVLKQLSDLEKQQKISTGLKGEKQSLILRLMDKQVKCEMENFYNVDGKCIRGQYIKNGERLVPAVGE